MYIHLLRGVGWGWWRPEGQRCIVKERRIIKISPLTTRSWRNNLLSTHTLSLFLLFRLKLHCLSSESLKYLPRRDRSFYPQAAHGGARGGGTWICTQQAGKFWDVSWLVFIFLWMLDSASQCSHDYFNVWNNVLKWYLCILTQNSFALLFCVSKGMVLLYCFPQMLGTECIMELRTLFAQTRFCGGHWEERGLLQSVWLG